MRYRNRLIGRFIILYELVGLGLIIATIWMDEFFDLPHRILDTPPTPFNWPEALIETIILVVLGALLVTATAATLKRFRYLEGFLSMCAQCRKVNDDGRWVAVEEYIAKNTDAVFSHGFCPDCLKVQMDEIDRMHPPGPSHHTSPHTHTPGSTS